MTRRKVNKEVLVAEKKMKEYITTITNDPGVTWVEPLPTMPYMPPEGDFIPLPSPYPNPNPIVWSPSVSDTNYEKSCCDVQKGTIDIIGDLESDMVRDVVLGVREMIRINIKKITVTISSYGGDACAALAIVDYLFLAKETGIEIVTIATGACCSGACFIFLAGDKRIMSKRTYFMMHNIQVDIEFESIDNVLMDLKVWQKLVSELLGNLLHSTKVDKSFVLDKIKGKNWVITATTCKKHGFVTEYLTKERPLNVKRTNKK